MNSTQDIIRGYSAGMKYRELEIEDLVEVDAILIEKLSAEYGVNIDEFETNKKELFDYLSKFNHIVEYQMLMRKNECRGLASIIGILLSALLSLIICHFSLYIGLTVFVPLSLLFTVLIAEYLKKWNKKRNEKKYLKIYVGERNRNVENYINEVMFQAYVRNRNPRIEYKYSRI